MPKHTDPLFDGVLSSVQIGLTSGGVALSLELTSQSGDEAAFMARLFPEDARRVATALTDAAKVAEMGTTPTTTRQ